MHYLCLAQYKNYNFRVQIFFFVIILSIIYLSINLFIYLPVYLARSCNPDWSLTHCVAKDDLTFWSFCLCLLSIKLKSVCYHAWVLESRARNPGSVHTTQALYQLSYSHFSYSVAEQEFEGYHCLWQLANHMLKNKASVVFPCRAYLLHRRLARVPQRCCQTAEQTCSSLVINLWAPLLTTERTEARRAHGPGLSSPAHTRNRAM